MKAVLFLGAPWGEEEDLFTWDPSSCSAQHSQMRTDPRRGGYWLSPWLEGAGVWRSICYLVLGGCHAQFGDPAPRGGGFLSPRYRHGWLLYPPNTLFKNKKTNKGNGGWLWDQSGLVWTLLGFEADWLRCLLAALAHVNGSFLLFHPTKRAFPLTLLSNPGLLQSAMVFKKQKNF